MSGESTWRIRVTEERAFIIDVVALTVEQAKEAAVDMVRDGKVTPIVSGISETTLLLTRSRAPKVER